MGFSLTASFAVLCLSVFIVLGIMTSSLLPAISDVNTAFITIRKEGIDEVQTALNITGIIDGVTGMWFNQMFKFRKMISFDSDKIGGSLDDFPVLIDITDTDLKYHVLQSNGNDIAFTENSHSMQLSHQIELYDSSTGHLVAWVNTMHLEPKTAFTVIFMYYGNATCANQQDPSGVWDSDYHGVWHLNESSGTVGDSTTYENHGTSYNSPSYNVDGKIAGAMQFDGSNDYVSCGDPVDGSLDFGIGDFTIEFWVKTQTTNTRGIIVKTAYPVLQNPGYAVWIASGGLQGIIIDENQGLQSINTVETYNDNAWHHVAIIWNRNTYVYLVIDGVVDNWDNCDISDSISSINQLWFARRLVDPGPKYDYFNGILDEIRISSTARSTDWISTSYENQNSPSTFYTIGEETTLYLTVFVENTGSVNLEAETFTVLVNGTKYDHLYNRPYLYPLEEIKLICTSQIPSGEKRIKVIAYNGVEAYYEKS